jgi:hypothetical protein
MNPPLLATLKDLHEPPVGEFPIGALATRIDGIAPDEDHFDDPSGVTGHRMNMAIRDSGRRAAAGEGSDEPPMTHSRTAR